MAMWVFGYGSLVWNPGFAHDARLVGFVRDYRRVFYQGKLLLPACGCISSNSAARFVRLCVDPLILLVLRSPRCGQGARTTGARRSSPGGQSRSSTSPAPHAGELLTKFQGSKISRQLWRFELQYLEVREKQYDEKIYLDLYTDSSPKTPAVKNVMVYLATTNKESNQNYLGPAPLEEMAKQIFLAEGPTGPNKEYLFKLEDALNKIGVVDPHVQDLANAVRKYSDTALSS